MLVQTILKANDSLGNKDKKMKIRISKNEAKETRYWLKHILIFEDKDLEIRKQNLIVEANELMLHTCCNT